MAVLLSAAIVVYASSTEAKVSVCLLVTQLLQSFS